MVILLSLLNHVARSDGIRLGPRSAERGRADMLHLFVCDDLQKMGEF